jgi:redox-regulated HSP33 family molecular chaperone
MQEYEVKCQFCKKVYIIKARPEQIEAWKAGALIQNVMPYLSDNDRELLISGTCEPCFDKLFGGE